MTSRNIYINPNTETVLARTKAQAIFGVYADAQQSAVGFGLYSPRCIAFGSTVSSNQKITSASGPMFEMLN